MGGSTTTGPMPAAVPVRPGGGSGSANGESGGGGWTARWLPGRRVRIGALLVPAVALLFAAAPASLRPVRAESAGVSGPALITMVVPFAAGGPTDAVARALAAAITEQTGQPVRVDNRPGAGGTRGAAEVARAAPDGRTVLLHHVGMATAPALYRRLAFDPRRDFSPVGRVVDVPMTLVAPSAAKLPPAAAVGAWLRDSAGGLVVAYAGPGAASHLCGLLLGTALGVDLIHVPYGGTGPALRDLEAGRVDLMCDQTTNTATPIRAGRIQPIGVAASRRLPGLPQVPMLAEIGIRGLELSIWHGLFAPHGVPEPALSRLADLLQAGLAAPSFRRAMAGADVLVASAEQASPAALAGLLARETVRWTSILKKAGHHAD